MRRTERSTGAALGGLQKAIDELGSAVPYLTTTEAMDICRVKVSWDTFTAYPDFVLPRTVLNPHARRKAYAYDPRDVLALPFVLRQWEQAVSRGEEGQFISERNAFIRARDYEILNAITISEAA